MKRKILKLNLYAGILVLISSSTLVVLEIPFMKTWFYSFVWWSLILILDSLNFRKRKISLLFNSLENFLKIAFLSVFIWLIFEMFNLRLKNWSYLGLPENLGERWLGYFIGFATVLPVLREGAFFVESFFPLKRLNLFRLRAGKIFLLIFFFLGLISLILVCLWPKIFFPLVWLQFLFLLEPLNFLLGRKTFISDFTRREWKWFWCWMISGFSAGILWEFWNFWSGSYWKYSLPYLNFCKVFQMPIFGYLGFLPFSLEVFALFQFLTWVLEKFENRRWLKVPSLIIFFLICGLSFHLIDKTTLVR